MANITQVDYEGLPTQAGLIRTEGKNLYDNLKKLFQEAQNMHSNWYGIRYNSFITELNSMIPAVNDILRLVVDDIPIALETVAKNYALADGAAPKAVNEKELPTVEAVESVTDVGLRFVSTSVATNKTNIETYISNSVQNLSTIQTYWSEVVWESDAATAFGTKFETLKSSIENALNSVKSNLTKLMAAAEEDISLAESNNTVG